MAKVTGFNYFRTESPSDNIRIKFEDGSEFYTSTRLQGFSGYNCVRKLFPQLCNDHPDFKGPFKSVENMRLVVEGTEITQEEYNELMSSDLG